MRSGDGETSYYIWYCTLRLLSLGYIGCIEHCTRTNSFTNTYMVFITNTTKLWLWLPGLLLLSTLLMGFYRHLLMFYFYSWFQCITSHMYFCYFSLVFGPRTFMMQFGGIPNQSWAPNTIQCTIPIFITTLDNFSHFVIKFLVPLEFLKGIVSMEKWRRNDEGVTIASDDTTTNWFHFSAAFSLLIQVIFTIMVKILCLGGNIGKWDEFVRVTC